MNPAVLIAVSLAALVGPRPAPPARPTAAPPMVVYCWSDETTGRWCYTVGTEAEESRPIEHTWDAFAGVIEGPCWQLQLAYEIPVEELWRRARARAMLPVEPLPCFPGEDPGDLAGP